MSSFYRPSVSISIGSNKQNTCLCLFLFFQPGKDELLQQDPHDLAAEKMAEMETMLRSTQPLNIALWVSNKFNAEYAAYSSS